MNGPTPLLPTLCRGDAGEPGRLTPFWHAAYHPPDDDAPCAFGRQARLRAFRG